MFFHNPPQTIFPLSAHKNIFLSAQPLSYILLINKLILPKTCMQARKMTTEIPMNRIYEGEQMSLVKSNQNVFPSHMILLLNNKLRKPEHYRDPLFSRMLTTNQYLVTKFRTM